MEGWRVAGFDGWAIAVFCHCPWILFAEVEAFVSMLGFNGDVNRRVVIFQCTVDIVQGGSRIVTFVNSVGLCIANDG